MTDILLVALIILIGCSLIFLCNSVRKITHAILKEIRVKKIKAEQTGKPRTNWDAKYQTR